MDNKGFGVLEILIAIGVLILLILAFLLGSGISGNVITGSAMNEELIEEEYFKIGNKLNDEVNLNDTQNNGGSG